MESIVGAILPPRLTWVWATLRTANSGAQAARYRASRKSSGIKLGTGNFWERRHVRSAWSDGKYGIGFDEESVEAGREGARCGAGCGQAGAAHPTRSGKCYCGCG